MCSITTARRDFVLRSYDAAVADNKLLFLEGDSRATSEYIYPNQKEDAHNIVDIFYKNNCRVVSIQKKTKIGADGLMIEIAKLLTTHSDDSFVVNPSNVRIITGMSNVKWEMDMIDKAPSCFKKSIFHHGKLFKSNLTNIRNGLIIIDEIDTGDKELQVLHNVLKDANMLDIKHMTTYNNRFVIISATMIKELYDLYKWGDLHRSFKMTIPDTYCGHKDFLENGIIDEFYPLDTIDDIDRWIHEDILDNYDTDYRVHIVRVHKKNEDMFRQACHNYELDFISHTSLDKISPEQFIQLFEEKLMRHAIIGVKGLMRRANLIPNQWKIRIGAIHERFTKNTDYNVQIQGLVGRMTGYWKNIIQGGHKTGPYRTSIEAIEAYEMVYLDPFGNNSYQSSGFSKRNGKVHATPTVLSAKNIKNLHVEQQDDAPQHNTRYLVYADENVVKQVCNILKDDLKQKMNKRGYIYMKPKAPNADGFLCTAARGGLKACSLKQAIDAIPCNNGRTRNKNTKNELHRTCFPCYEDIHDNTTLRFVVPIRYYTDDDIVQECIQRYPPIEHKID
jgi:hypothetical protein